MTETPWETANRLLAEMPLRAAVRFTRRAERRAGTGRPDRRERWRRVYWQLQDNYAAGLSDAEPKPLVWTVGNCPDIDQS